MAAMVDCALIKVMTVRIDGWLVGCQVEVVMDSRVSILGIKVWFLRFQKCWLGLGASIKGWFRVWVLGDHGY